MNLLAFYFGYLKSTCNSLFAFIHYFLSMFYTLCLVFRLRKCSVSSVLSVLKDPQSEEKKRSQYFFRQSVYHLTRKQKRQLPQRFPSFDENLSKAHPICVSHFRTFVSITQRNFVSINSLLLSYLCSLLGNHQGYWRRSAYSSLWNSLSQCS